jgi:exopolysaccharide biosynthesis polyprenyl glycosylphosphotransferase
VSRGRFVFASVVVDIAIWFLGMVAAFVLRFGGSLPIFNFRSFLVLSPLLAAVYLTCAWIYGLYEPERLESFWAIVRSVVSAVTLSTLLTLGIVLLAGPAFYSFPRLVLAVAWPVQMLVLVGWRVAALRFTPIRWPEQRVLIVGAGPLSRELAEELGQRAKWGYRVVGMVARDEDFAAAYPADAEIPLLGIVHDLTHLVTDLDIDRVIVASPVALRELVEDITLNSSHDVRVDVIPELYEIFIGTVDAIVADIPLMEITHRANRGAYPAAKRVLDVVLSLVALVVASPFMLVFALLILVSMGAPVLLRQERLGRDMKPFTLVKFRSMVKDAEKLSGPVLACDDDPRITPLGRFMRKYRVDELPQLVNILLGEMSFVGPRPERAFFVERFLKEIPGYRERYRMKPGVTGLAQISGSYATTAQRKLKYDLIYLYHQNLLMDVQILFDTVRVVLTGRGAR